MNFKDRLDLKIKVDIQEMCWQCFRDTLQGGIESIIFTYNINQRHIYLEPFHKLNTGIYLSKLKEYKF